jgi:hypothetical protein
MLAGRQTEVAVPAVDRDCHLLEILGTHWTVKYHDQPHGNCALIALNPVSKYNLMGVRGKCGSYNGPFAYVECVIVRENK